MRSITTILKLTLGFGIIAPLGILGIVTSLKDWRRFLILYAFLFVYLISILIMYNIARYRIPAVPILIIFAASYLHWLYFSFKEGRFRNSFISVILLVVLFFGVNYRIDGIDPYKLYFATEYSKMGKSYLLENKFSEAKESYNNILKIDSNSLDGYLGLGRIALTERNFPEAVKHLQKAITIDPSNYRSYLNLAFAYKEVGKTSEAQEMLNKAVRLNPDIWKM